MNHSPVPASRSPRLAALLLATLALCGLPGCAPYATYPPDGVGPNVYPWMPPCPEVMATALRQAHDRVAPDSQFIYNLPPGASRTAWKDVQSRLGPGARRMLPGDTVVWDVERFGIRNTRAFADILYWNDGRGILLTVSLQRDNLLPFRFSHIQRFYIKADSMPRDNYPAPDVEVDVTQETDVTVETDSSVDAGE